MQKPSRLIKLILPVILALLLALTGCATLVQLISPTPTPTATPTATPTPTPTPSPTPTATPEPNVQDFIVGTNDEHGYHSDFFRFGFLVPTSYVIDERSNLNQENGIDSSLTDPETIRKALIMRLKMQEILYDFLSGNTDDQCCIQILVRDYNSLDMTFESESEFLEHLEPWLLSTDEKDRNENLVKTTVQLAGEEHPLYRYEVILNGVQLNGMIFTIKRGTTFAVIQMTTGIEEEMDYVLDSFYSLD